MTERRVFSLRGFVTLLAIVGLTITLAGRVFQGSLYPSTSAHSGTSYERVQHRDSDAARWVPPTASYTLLWTAERSVAPDPIEQIHFHPHYDSLYNRPPPVSESRHSASF